VHAGLIPPLRRNSLLLIALLAAAVACSGGKDATGPSLGTLVVSVAGLPVGATPSVLVSGPDSFSHPVTTASATLTDLTPGAYTVAASTVTVGGGVYSASPASQSAQVSAGGNATAGVTYLAAPGGLNLTVSGLPGGVNAAVTITGPGGYSVSETGSAALANLAPGNYTVTATSVSGAGGTYDPSPSSQSVAVSSNSSASGAVNYVVHSSATLNLRIDGFYVTQSVQTYDRSVSLVAGRGGFLRVFVVANQANTATPEVRARFYKAGVLLQTLTIAAPAANVPTDTVGSQAALSRTWNAALPSTLLQSGLQVVLDVDPTNLVPESDDADNSYPVNATPLNLNVQTAAALNLRFVPVLRTADGTTGAVTGGNAAQYADQTVRMHPLAVVNVDVRSPYTYSDTAQIQSNDGNGVWLKILSQINALQAAEGGTKNYFGIIAVPYGGGIAGYGYVPGRSAVGWDKLPSASGVVAHELGHNFGRQHAPCGGAGSPDPNYPYPGGVTGQWGYDMVAGVLKPPTSTDLMGYCSSVWISDYNYSAILNDRGAGPDIVQVSAVREPSLIVWGRIQDGAVILEPAFEATTEARLPLVAGPNLLQGLNTQGGEAFRLAFSGVPVADAPNGESQFAFAIPLRMVHGTLAALTLQARGRQVELRGTGALAAGASRGLTLERRGQRTTVRWNNTGYPLAVVRDAATGRILSLAHDGQVTVEAAGALDVTLSDRIGSRTTHLR